MCHEHGYQDFEHGRAAHRVMLLDCGIRSNKAILHCAGAEFVIHRRAVVTESFSLVVAPFAWITGKQLSRHDILPAAAISHAVEHELIITESLASCALLT